MKNNSITEKNVEYYIPKKHKFRRVNSAAKSLWTTVQVQLKDNILSPWGYTGLYIHVNQTNYSVKANCTTCKLIWLDCKQYSIIAL